ncbi:helix-turn-helix transcriptional regulator [Chitinophaga oryzae]|uniref:Helix-turn-helix transcriptional regulator n=1 Tax=Chitinophaga oryzae TaxID=2725414 RepID=A0AAE6ZGW0_9BACT|nr:helix-turn-helix domain-containing protein [Chitinophaga oryzae]QJB32870.1 helix-turn-helix transcriptional regulator [Chitinophaga oryzae]QJB39325.1 helix-turn-helix transcriptional regulator [Chitinophaga oryzae]
MKKTDSRQVECAAHLASVEDAIYVLGGKWKLRIMIALVSGYHRFNELQRTITGISARILSSELKSLELNGLVKRVVKADQTPVLVEYLPTEYAETLKEVITVLGNWGLKHKKRITGKTQNSSQPS